MGPKLIAIAVFAVAYVLVVVFYDRKVLIVWGAVALLLVTGILTPLEAVASVDWNVILLYVGMLFVSEVFLESKMPDYLAVRIASKARTVGMAMVLLCAFTGVLSMALENVAVVLLVAPVALAIANKCGINPVALFIGMAVSSNLQGAATLIGDPPSMLMAGYARLGFNDFFLYGGRLGIFFSVQAGFIVSLLVLSLVFRPYRTPMPKLAEAAYDSLVPALIVVALVAALVVVSSIHHGVDLLTGLTCLAFGLAAFGYREVVARTGDSLQFIKRMDWMTGLFLIGIFVLVDSLSAVGVMEDVAAAVLDLAGGSLIAVFLLVVGVSVVVSAFVDNVPFLVAMLPVLTRVTESLGAERYGLFAALLIGASIGGNVTPIGASANVVAMGIMKQNGHRTSFLQFVRIGLPFTIASVGAAAGLLWVSRFA